MGRRIGLVLACAFAASIGVGLHAQAGGQGEAPLDRPGVSAAEIQRLFDAYTVMQAQEQLQLSDAQFAQFLTRMRALQDVRRRHQQERGRLLQDLRRLAQGDPADDGQLRDRIRALRDVDVRGEDEVRKAYDSLDAILTPRQQARFRVFEEQMERRKIELLTRARANNRAKR